MRYVDAGYAAALGTLFAYSISLFVRRRRLTQLALKATRLAPEEQLPEDQKAKELL